MKTLYGELVNAAVREGFQIRVERVGRDFIKFTWQWQGYSAEAQYGALELGNVADVTAFARALHKSVEEGFKEHGFKKVYNFMRKQAGA